LLADAENIANTVSWRRTVGGAGKCWVAELGSAKLRVRPARLPRSGMFVGHINEQRIGYWSSPEIAKTHVTKFALLYRREPDFVAPEEYESP